ncbi:MAG: DUF4214 domain-containing protein [Lachnospiraceae bacterium]|nr:DUF4214 domain-containing protein [Lachnospiraceae bacterium]
MIRNMYRIAGLLSAAALLIAGMPAPALQAAEYAPQQGMEESAELPADETAAAENYLPDWYGYADTVVIPVDEPVDVTAADCYYFAPSEKAVQLASDASFWRQFHHTAVYNLLTADERECWHRMEEACIQVMQNAADDFASIAVRTDDLTLDHLTGFQINNMFKLSHPQFFILNNVVNSIPGVVRLYPEFQAGADRSAAVEEFTNVVSGWIRQANATSLPEAKEQVLHDLICVHTTYDHAAAENPGLMYDSQTSRIDWEQGAYSLIHDGATVCAGYAATAGILLNAVGIRTINVTGSSHAWNLVQLHNHWYLFDATWDDNDDGTYDYGYYNVAGQRRNGEYINGHVAESSSLAEWDGLIPDTMEYSNCVLDEDSGSQSHVSPYFTDADYQYFITNGLTTRGDGTYTAEVVGALNGDSLSAHPATVTYAGKTYNVTQTAATPDVDDPVDDSGEEDTTWQNDYEYEYEYGTGSIFLSGYTGTAANLAVPAIARINGREYRTHISSRRHSATGTGFCVQNTVSSFAVENGVVIDSMYYMFYGCTRLTSVNLTNMNLQNVTDAECAFYGCSALTSLDLSGWDMSGVTDAYGMLSGCSALTSIRTPKNLNLDVPLPGRFFDRDGNAYTFLPKETNESIRLSTQQDTIPDDDTEALVRAFVARMYTEALGREAEGAGLEHWTRQLLDHVNDGAGLAQGFIMGEEFANRGLSNAEYLTVLYSTFFNRDPDEVGFNGWLDYLNRGYTRAYVLSGFVNSPEFENLCEAYGIVRGIMNEDGTAVNPGIRRFVERLYTRCLGRSGEKDGIDYWVRGIASGSMEAAWVARVGFFFSPEYLDKETSNEVFVTDMYRALFDREPDASGFADWMGRLEAGADRLQIIYGFTDSEEFFNLLESFGLL